MALLGYHLRWPSLVLPLMVTVMMGGDQYFFLCFALLIWQTWLDGSKDYTISSPLLGPFFLTCRMTQSSLCPLHLGGFILSLILFHASTALGFANPNLPELPFHSLSCRSSKYRISSLWKDVQGSRTLCAFLMALSLSGSTYRIGPSVALNRHVPHIAGDVAALATLIPQQQREDPQKPTIFCLSHLAVTGWYVMNTESAHPLKA